GRSGCERARGIANWCPEKGTLLGRPVTVERGLNWRILKEDGLRRLTAKVTCRAPPSPTKAARPGRRRRALSASALQCEPRLRTEWWSWRHPPPAWRARSSYRDGREQARPARLRH